MNASIRDTIRTNNLREAARATVSLSRRARIEAHEPSEAAIARQMQAGATDEAQAREWHVERLIAGIERELNGEIAGSWNPMSARKLWGQAR